MGLRSATIQPSVNMQSQSNPNTKARRFLGKKTPRFCLELKIRRKDHLEHDHDCIHTHDHPHTSAPRDELIAQIRCMAGHNVSHTNELNESIYFGSAQNFE